MKGALIILIVTVAVGVVLYINDLRSRKTIKPDAEPEPAVEPKCCGLHLTCEKDSLSPTLTDKIVYYDDHELDAFAGRGADSYTDEEADQFRDVMLTTRPDEIAGWVRSLQLRGINLPSDVRDELFILVDEYREKNI